LAVAAQIAMRPILNARARPTCAWRARDYSAKRLSTLRVKMQHPRQYGNGVIWRDCASVTFNRRRITGGARRNHWFAKGGNQRG